MLSHRTNETKVFVRRLINLFSSSNPSLCMKLNHHAAPLHACNFIKNKSAKSNHPSAEGLWIMAVFSIGQAFSGKLCSHKCTGCWWVPGQESIILLRLCPACVAYDLYSPQDFCPRGSWGLRSWGTAVSQSWPDDSFFPRPFVISLAPGAVGCPTFPCFVFM